MLPDAVASTALAAYASLNFKPPDGQFTVLAAFVLSDAQSSKVISLGTGSKCLPASRLPKNGDALHDCHAEVLARRGAIRWLIEEIARSFSPSSPLSPTSPWIRRDNDDGRYALRQGVELAMYISTVPCGDASTRYLASSQDTHMAALKDSAPRPAVPPPNATSRGRDNYSLYGVMRTKPGRADSPPTLSLSCSDKIAAWNVLGLQGALASRLLHPIYIRRVVIGEVAPSMRHLVRADCERALYARLRGISTLESPFVLNEPSIEFTSLEFVHSRSAITPTPASGCNDSLCWVADAEKPSEVLINGIRRGVSPKHRHNTKFRPRPMLCKLSLYGLVQEVATKVQGPPDPDRTCSYFEAKQLDVGYGHARRALKGVEGPFAGWLTSGREWENFDETGAQVERVQMDSTPSEASSNGRLAPQCTSPSPGSLSP